MSVTWYTNWADQTTWLPSKMWTGDKFVCYKMWDGTKWLDSCWGVEEQVHPYRNFGTTYQNLDVSILNVPYPDFVGDYTIVGTTTDNLIAYLSFGNYDPATDSGSPSWAGYVLVEPYNRSLDTHRVRVVGLIERMDANASDPDINWWVYQHSNRRAIWIDNGPKYIYPNTPSYMCSYDESTNTIKRTLYVPTEQQDNWGVFRGGNGDDIVYQGYVYFSGPKVYHHGVQSLNADTGVVSSSVYYWIENVNNPPIYSSDMVQKEVIGMPNPTNALIRNTSQNPFPAGFSGTVDSGWTINSTSLGWTISLNETGRTRGAPSRVDSNIARSAYVTGLTLEQFWELEAQGPPPGQVVVNGQAFDIQLDGPNGKCYVQSGKTGPDEYTMSWTFQFRSGNTVTTIPPGTTRVVISTTGPWFIGELRSSISPQQPFASFYANWDNTANNGDTIELYSGTNVLEDSVKVYGDVSCLNYKKNETIVASALVNPWVENGVEENKLFYGILTSVNNTLSWKLQKEVDLPKHFKWKDMTRENYGGLYTAQRKVALGVDGDRIIIHPSMDD